MSSLVRYSVAEGVAHLELNRPKVNNALDLELVRALQAAATRADAEEEVRAVLVTAAGERFCVGGDVASFATASDSAAYLHQLATAADQAMRFLAESAKPVVAAVHGAVAGAGLGLMLSCDLVVARPDTKFVFAYPAIGLTPDCGVSWLLPRAIGQQRALAFALGGEPLPAPEALPWGLITELSDEPTDRALELARSLASGPAAALGHSRRLLRDGWNENRSGISAKEAFTIRDMVQSDEAQKRISRFIQA